MSEASTIRSDSEKLILNGAERAAGLIPETDLKADNEITVIM